MNAGDFDLVVGPTEGQAYYYIERVHSQMTCADLTPGYTGVTGLHNPLPRARQHASREGHSYVGKI